MKKQRLVTTDFQRTQRMQEIQNEEAAETQARERAAKNLDFVQFQRAGMRQFVGLIHRSPAAAQALIAFAAFMNRSNMVAIPMKTLQGTCDTSRATMSRAVKILSDEGWVRVTRIGSTRAYQVNADILWSAARDKKVFSDIYTSRITVSSSGGGSKGGEAEFVLRAKPVPIVTVSLKKSASRSRKQAPSDE